MMVMDWWHAERSVGDILPIVVHHAGTGRSESLPSRCLCMFINSAVRIASPQFSNGGRGTLHVTLRSNALQISDDHTFEKSSHMAVHSCTVLKWHRTMYRTAPRRLHAHLFLILVVGIILKVRSVVNSRKECGRLLGDGLDDGGSMGRNASVLQEFPELLRVLDGSHLVVIGVRSFQHEELAEELEGVGDLFVVVIELLQLADRRWTNAWDFRQIACNGGRAPFLHAVIGDLRSAWVVSFVSHLEMRLQ
mmetsp:Transcript_19078/g.52998  ORF Transcript_19078/g.52998 Transcript_19078/m.52998 type:complete len:249 (-) Transcript_19078:319-1065(-)